MAAMANYQEPPAAMFNEARDGVLAGLVNEEFESPITLAQAARENEDFQERVLEVNRVSKSVKGGKLMGFR